MDIYSIGTDVKRVKICEINDSKEEEEARMIDQAKRAYWLERAFDSRMPEVIHFEGPLDMQLAEDRNPKELKVHANLVATITHVVLNFPWGEKNYLGTLEGHVDGFRYSVRDFHVDIMHANVQSYIFRHGHGGPPRLQYHLYQPICVCGREEKDIQFCLFPTTLDEVREGGPILDSRRDKDLDEFLLRIEKIHETCRMDGIDHIPVDFEAPDFEFDGESPNGAFVSIGLTASALVVLTETPFLVVPLREIEIVNLALQETETVDMTATIDMVVVFADYKLDVLKISSVPLKYLTSIKHCLNSSNVKYYVNHKRLAIQEWNNLLRDIEKHPRKFKDEGGWASFEDQTTRIKYYPLAFETEGKIDCHGLDGVIW